MSDLKGEKITIEYIPLDDAVLWDANPKTHDIGSLCESILRYGFVDPPKFDAQLGAFVYGNGRTVALRMMRDQGKEPPRGILHDDDGQWYIPVKFGVDQASRDVAQALAVDHNNLTMLGGEFAVWDVAKMWDESYPDLLRLLAEAEALPVSVDGDDLDALLKEFDAGDGGDAPEAQVDRAAELQEKWGVKQGDVWEIPSRTVEGRCHRLMCGDSTSAEDVARLMGDIKAFCFTDPPYNVGKDYGDNVNDLKAADEYMAWSALWFSISRRFCDAVAFTPGSVNIWMWASIEPPKWMAIWVKKNQRSRNGAGGWNAYEPVLCYGKVKINYDVWDGLVQDENVGHIVNKTLMPWRTILDDLAKESQDIFDPFIGSGTTIVACEQTGRVCHGLEIEPKYCAVTLERLQGLGLEPRRVS